MRRALLVVALALLLAPASISALPPEQESQHVVADGETLNGIANRAGVPRDRIIEANGLKSPFVLRTGQKLAIPRSKPAEPKTAKRTIPARQDASSSSLAQASSYIVKPGDSLGSIALRAQIPRILIAEANGIADPFPVRIGQELILPRTRRHTVAAGETGFAIAYKYAVSWEQIAIANGIGADAALPAGKQLLIPTVINPPKAAPTPAATPTPAVTTPSALQFAWPLAGPIRRGFAARGTSEYHDGIDISAPRGEAVRAIAGGKVIFARKDPDQFGNLVVVDHGNGWHSAYASLGRMTVKAGDDVSKGERVGLVGDTSVSRKTELHLEMRKGGKPVDPVEYLPGRP